jgi:hypothetical protein
VYDIPMTDQTCFFSLLPPDFEYFLDKFVNEPFRILDKKK